MRGVPTLTATPASTPDPTLPAPESPAFSAPATDWRHRAACRDLVESPETDPFFPPDRRETAQETLTRELRALAVCEGCPVRVQCLAYAVSTHQPTGVWGGRTEAQVQRLIAVSAGRASRRVGIDLSAPAGPQSGPGHHEARKTHCPQGHPYDEANTYLSNAGRRLCRACNRARALQQQARLAAKRTHCPAGHPYDEANTDYTAHGRRRCRECARSRVERRQRQQQERPAHRDGRGWSP